MKFAPALLLNVLVVGLGLFVYDKLQDDEPASERERIPTHMRPAPGTRGLTGSADRMLAHSSEARIASMEAAIGRLQAEVERLRSGKGANEGGSDEPAGPVKIDEKTLAWMTAYRQEILKREGEARLRTRMAEAFRRKGVQLADDLLEKVVLETFAFHDRAKALMRKPVERSTQGYAERKRAVRALRDQYEANLLGLVPAEQVELILGTRMGQARDILPRDED